MRSFSDFISEWSTRSRAICAATVLTETAKIVLLSDDSDELPCEVAKYIVEGDLRREVSMFITLDGLRL